MRIGALGQVLPLLFFLLTAACIENESATTSPPQGPASHNISESSFTLSHPIIKEDGTLVLTMTYVNEGATPVCLPWRMQDKEYAITFNISDFRTGLRLRSKLIEDDFFGIDFTDEEWARYLHKHRNRPKRIPPGQRVSMKYEFEPMLYGGVLYSPKGIPVKDYTTRMPLSVHAWMTTYNCNADIFTRHKLGEKSVVLEAKPMRITGEVEKFINESLQE